MWQTWVHFITEWTDIQIIWQVKELPYMYLSCEFSGLPGIQLQELLQKKYYLGSVTHFLYSIYNPI